VYMYKWSLARGRTFTYIVIGVETWWIFECDLSACCGGTWQRKARCIGHLSRL